jgi:hypothetical protein
VIARSIDLLYGPNSATPGAPTSTEVARETLLARWIGNYTISAPRFNDRASTIHITAKQGGSNQFLKGKLQINLYPPANPDATPNPGNPFANQVTGIATLFPQNYLQTGGLLNLDLNGTPATGAGANSLPTQMDWTYDSFSSAGPYAAPALTFNQGTGVVDFQYIPDRHPIPGTMGSGRVVVSFQGLINTNQIFSAVSRAYS